MDTEKRRLISRQYFDRDRLVSHQLQSFNDFLTDGLQGIVDERGPIETDLADQVENEEPISVELGEMEVRNPSHWESDGREHDLFPQEARLRNLTYAAPMFLEMEVIIGGRNRERHVLSNDVVQIGQLPIMVRSRCCNLSGLSNEELIEMGEDPVDPGGYFIVNGSERVLVTSEDLASNKILTELGEQRGDQIEIAKTFSQQEGYRALVTTKRDSDNLLNVSFPSVPGELPLPLVLRALGLETDREIADEFTDDPEILKFVLEILEESEVQSQETAISEIGSRIAPGKTRPEMSDRVQQVLDQHLLPHLNASEESSTRINQAKASHLCRMAQACFELALGRREPDDKDHYANKRLRSAGYLMENQFRATLNRLARDIEYQLKQTIGRERQVSLPRLVQSEVISDRLERALATGIWVGGRSGVAQLLDRTDHMGVLAHLRRLQSPLSRSRPHFDARDLHASQWGRVCPSETPEGPNCGLVKNFAQAVEFSSRGQDEEELERLLNSLGVLLVTTIL